MTWAEQAGQNPLAPVACGGASVFYPGKWLVCVSCFASDFCLCLAYASFSSMALLPTQPLSGLTFYVHD